MLEVSPFINFPQYQPRTWENIQLNSGLTKFCFDIQMDPPFAVSFCYPFFAISIFFKRIIGYYWILIPIIGYQSLLKLIIDNEQLL